MTITKDPGVPTVEEATEPVTEASKSVDVKNLWENTRLLQDNPSVQYRSMSQSSGAACGNCRWYKGEDFCHLVRSEPVPITAIGYCNRHELREADQPALLNLLQGLEDELEEEGVAVTFNVAQRSFIGRMIKSLLGADVGNDRSTGFKVLNDHEWVGWWTNNFEDRQKELFTEASIDNYIGRVKSGVIPYPELWFYHVPGTKHGQATQLWRVGHFAIAHGTFDKTPLADSFKAYYKKSKTLGMSHGFHYPLHQFKDGVFNEFTTFELTVLKPDAAANPYTTFKEVSSMSVSNETRKQMELALGPDIANQIINDATARGKALEASTKYKGDTGADTMSQVEALTFAVKELAAQMAEMKAGMTAPPPATPPATAPAAPATAPATAPPPATTQAAPAQDNKGVDPALELLVSEVKALNGRLEQYMSLQPRGTQSPSTQLNLSNPTDAQLAQFLQQQQKEQTRGKSLVQQAVLAGMGMPNPTL